MFRHKNESDQGSVNAEIANSVFLELPSASNWNTLINIIQELGASGELTVLSKWKNCEISA